MIANAIAKPLASETQMSWIDWVEANVKDAPFGFVHVRLGPGLFRTMHNIVRTSGWPAPLHQAEQCESENGLGDGDLSTNGLPRFIRNLNRASHSAKSARLGIPRIVTTASRHAYVGSHAMQRTEGADAVLRETLYTQSDELTSGPKSAAEDGTILELGRIARAKRVIFLGPSRNRPIARAAGCEEQDFFCVPSEGAVTMFDEAKRFIQRRIESSGVTDVLFLHGASWLGNSLAIEVALERRPEQGTFSSLDLGLSGTILDLEFLSTRPWFINNADKLLLTARSLATPLCPISENLGSEDICAFGASWKEATACFGRDPEQAIEILSSGLSRVSNDLDYFQIAVATRVLWSAHHHRLPTIPVELSPERIWKAEPALLMATVCLARSTPSLAKQFLDVAENIEPNHPYLKLLQLRNNRRSELSDLTPHLQRAGRDYLGSTLAWSLWGDYPGSETHILRT